MPRARRTLSVGRAPSIPIPKFASLRGTLVCELWNQGTLAIYDSGAVQARTHTLG